MRATLSNRLLGTARMTVAVAAASIACAGSASAYVGPSFFQIAGLSGGWKGAEHTNWVKADSNYWDVKIDTFGGFRRGMAWWSGPAGPASGPGRLVLAFNKDNPVLKKLMERCTKKTPIAEMSYAEDTYLARGPQQIGPRPAAIPAYFEYKLTDVTFVDCPVVADAPQQAIVVAFKDIKRLSYNGPGETVVFPTTEAAKLVPASFTNPGKSKAFVLTWFAFAADVADDQCPVMNKKPTEDVYYALMTKEEADKERTENAKHGGVNYENGQFGLRGPHKLDAMRMPGIVPDPGNAAPATKYARGLNLDGDDGTGTPPATTRKHINYLSPDGRTGIDNQLYTAQGCISSFQGHKGFIMQFSNNQMHDGMMSMLVEITGIDNDQNDDHVEVVFSYSLDPMAKSASGKEILSDYTFRATDKPMYSSYNTRLSGRIVNGAIVTDPVDFMSLNLGQYGTPNQLDLWKAGVRLEITPEGNLKGVLGGYMDWRPLISRYVTSTVENIHGFQVPGLYNAFRRLADGLRDPISGEYNGISSAYDIEGVPVFLNPPAPPKTAQADATPPAGRARQ